MNEENTANEENWAVDDSAARLMSDDRRHVVLNGGRYRCWLTASRSSLDVPRGYCFFSEAWREANSPTLTQCSDCYVFESEAPGAAGQYARLYRSVHEDLEGGPRYNLLLDDGTMVNVVALEVADGAGTRLVDDWPRQEDVGA